MNYESPILRKVIEHYKSVAGSIDDIRIVSFQHLLEPQIEMYNGFIELGVKPENIHALGKIYSSNKSVIEDLKALGIQALQPAFLGKPFDEEHRNNCLALRSKFSNEKVIILDDGAELINVFAENYDNVLFAVEQTSSGFRKLENLKHKFPIVNVARSKTKLTQESPLIARLCFERIVEHTQKYDLVNPKFLLIGLGPIGESMRQILTENNFGMAGYDKDDYSSIVDLINEVKPGVVIGATGAQIISEEELSQLSQSIHFISLSSSDREFPVSKLRTSSNAHDDIESGNLIFANGGFPITFKGNRYESTPVEIEKTISLLFGSVAHGIKIGYQGEGLINVPEELESQL